MASEDDDRVWMTEPPILNDRDNFSIWKKRMIAFLNFTDSYLLESITKGPHIPLVEESKWSDEDKQKVDLDFKAKRFLHLSLPNHILLCFFTQSNSAKEIWDELVLICDGGKENRYNLLIDDYEMFAYKDGESLTQTYIRFSRLVNELKEHNRRFDNGDMVVRFLTSVHPSLGHVSMGLLNSMNEKTMSLQSVYGTLLAHEFRLKHD